jgi:N-acetyl-gamma-glutamyl-phosphate reductase
MMLVRLLLEHPQVTSLVPVSQSAAGKRVSDVDPGIGDVQSPLLQETAGAYRSPEDQDLADADVLFSALPHKTSASIVGPLAGRIPIIDLSADFRFARRETYEKWYADHPYPELLDRSVYGLTEWHREEIRSAEIVACPGCYPTCTLLPLLPLADHIEGPLVVNALTGVSGAGRKLRQDLLFNERSENMAAYSPGVSHRHVPEIRESLSAAGAHGEVIFTPHLVPVKQGMLVTTVATAPDLTRESATGLIAQVYSDSPFVGMSTRDLPETRDVRYTNRCDISVRKHNATLVIISVIDNLYKGAAGQAVQNLNVRFGFDETAGLRRLGEF